MNAATFLETAAREHPDRVFIVDGVQRATFGEINRRANRLANGLAAAGIQTGDCVAMTCPSRTEFAVAYYAILKIGAVAATLNVLLKRNEIAEQLTDCRAKAYLAFEGTAESPMGQEAIAAFQATPSCKGFWAIPAGADGLQLLSECASWTELIEGQPDVFESADLSPDATCCITFTSGTTGRAKGVEHSHAVEGLVPYLMQNDYQAAAHDVFLLTVPLFTLWKTTALHLTCLAGATVVVMPRFSPEETWRLMERERVTVLIVSGAVFRFLYDAMDHMPVDYDRIARHWRLCLSGGFRIPADLHRFFRDRFKIAILSMYGSTELHGISLTREVSEDTDDCVGRLFRGVQVRIVDETMNDVPLGETGEILVRTPTLMKGYCGNPAETEKSASAGWFHTGDMGRRNPDGHLFLTGRIKDMINRKGMKVFSAQVESALLAHPAIARVAVVGIPDEFAGEEVKAFVQLRDGLQCSPDELIAWARERIAAYAYPRHVEFVDNLPIGPTGKVLKHLLPRR
ncbi:MAG TPA: AMP-binding protein [Candidatus Hydrogenedentes bacterium]|nr:AMP-binding protein [Candidatus Hydrogenedentota bacterium]HPC17712.1 AMP-binding protein [Candidatus Hydrogenedentota bacterium]HRT21092.1 AMP-binding protein [Candidatus Hydrogenedentota bacterium]HRT66035.1 AMP-binding protein [Candidatus Hydrogenedentota bacterium]